MLLRNWNCIAWLCKDEGGKGAGLGVRVLVFRRDHRLCNRPTTFFVSLQNIEIEFDLISVWIRKYLMAWRGVGQWLRNIGNLLVKKRMGGLAMITFDYGGGGCKKCQNIVYVICERPHIMHIIYIIACTQSPVDELCPSLDSSPLSIQATKIFLQQFGAQWFTNNILSKF